MSFHLTTNGSITELPTDKIDRANAAPTVITSREEWETIAGAWPLKRLVEIWNALPGVTPIEKFTSRQIALERIWRAVEAPEQARGKAQGKGGKAPPLSERPSSRNKLGEKHRGKEGRPRSAFGKARKQPRCMTCSAVRKESR